VQVRVQDDGTWRPPPADKGHRGRGLELITALAVDVQVTPRPGPGSGTTVTFRLPPRSDAPAPEVGAAGPVEGAAAWAANSGAAQVLTSAEGNVVRWEVTGELDLATVGAVRAALLARLRGLPAGSRVDLDLGSTRYLASAGVGMVLQVLGEAADRAVQVRLRAAPGTPTARVLALAGLENVLVREPRVSSSQPLPSGPRSSAPPIG